MSNQKLVLISLSRILELSKKSAQDEDCSLDPPVILIRTETAKEAVQPHGLMRIWRSELSLIASGFEVHHRHATTKGTRREGEKGRFDQENIRCMSDVSLAVVRADNGLRKIV